MVFLGHELDYGAQARDHDWVEKWEQEVSRRKQEQPAWLFLSRCARPFRGGAHDRMLAQTLRWRREGRLADLGCGEGLFLERAARYFEVTGVELSPRAAEAARRRVGAERILEGPVTEVGGRFLPEKSFDVVTLFGYLEHEWHPLEGLRAARRILKQGGTLLGKVPNYASWNRSLRGQNWCGYHIPAHCNYFTPETLARMLRETGFEPLPRRLLDRLPTSDSLWMAARRS